MAKRSTKFCQGKDVFERMNFLYQAATMMAGKNSALAQYYGQQCKVISRKSLQRMEPDLKRTICKRCGTVLIPNVTNEIDIISEANGKRKVCLIECLTCKNVKRFVLSEKYNLWLDKSDAVKEIIQPEIHKS